MDILRSIRDFHEHGARSIDYIDHQSQQQLQIPCFPCLPPYASICESIFTIFYAHTFLYWDAFFRAKR